MALKALTFAGLRKEAHTDVTVLARLPREESFQPTLERCFSVDFFHRESAIGDLKRFSKRDFQTAHKKKRPRIRRLKSGTYRASNDRHLPVSPSQRRNARTGVVSIMILALIAQMFTKPPAKTQFSRAELAQ